jgi:hypothetical protein
VASSDMTFYQIESESVSFNCSWYYDLTILFFSYRKKSLANNSDYYSHLQISCNKCVDMNVSPVRY